MKSEIPLEVLVVMYAIFVVAFAVGIGIGWAVQSKQTIHTSPVIVIPELYIIYPVPTREI